MDIKTTIIMAALMLCLTACTTPLREGTWVLGANKMHVFIPKKPKKECKLVPGWRGAGLRAIYGYQKVCKPIKTNEK